MSSLAQSFYNLLTDKLSCLRQHGKITGVGGNSGLRKKIVEFHAEGNGSKTVCNSFNMAKSTVGNIIMNHRNTRLLENRSECGRKKGFFTDLVELMLIRMNNNYPKITIPGLCFKFCD